MRRDSASGELGDAETAFSGKLTYAYAATSDSDCAEFANGTSGLPLALPCSLSYALSGARVSE